MTGWLLTYLVAGCCVTLVFYTVLWQRWATRGFTVVDAALSVFTVALWPVMIWRVVVEARGRRRS